MKLVLASMAVIATATVAGGCAPSQPLQPHPIPQQVNCEPANGRQGQLGCWFLASMPVPPSGGPLYWHVYEYDSPELAQRSVGEKGRVIRAYGRTWAVSVAGRDFAISGGRRVAMVGPLDLIAPGSHSASFMEATFIPGMRSRIHTHPGPEAWYVLEGEQCLETPEGIIRVQAGESMMVKGGIPMALFGTGTGIRRAILVIVHPSGEPLGMTHEGWQPTGACLAG